MAVFHNLAIWEEIFSHYQNSKNETVSCKYSFVKNEDKEFFFGRPITATGGSVSFITSGHVSKLLFDPDNHVML